MNWRRAAVTALALLGGLAVLWSAGWYVVARQFEARIEGWAAARRAEGWTAMHGGIAVAGFPHAWRARIERPRLAGAVQDTAGFAWSGPWVVVRWVPWQPSMVGLRARGAHRLAWRGVPVRLHAASIRGFLDFGAEGHLARAGLGGDDLTVTPPEGEPVRINRAIVRAATGPDVPTAPAGPPPALGAEIDVLGLTVPARAETPLGRTVGRVTLRATLMGAIPPGPPTAALTAWRDAGGTLEIDRFALAWGALTAEGSGTLALDMGLQPEGALTARIAGYGETIDRLAGAGVLDRSQSFLTKMALGALARTPEGGGRPEITVPVSVQDRILRVGPVDLLPLPRIRWQ